MLIQKLEAAVAVPHVEREAIVDHHDFNQVKDVGATDLVLGYTAYVIRLIHLRFTN